MGKFPFLEAVTLADSNEITLVRPIELGSGLIATSLTDLIHAILAATGKQVEEKAIADAEGRADFTISSDALNFWRMAWRCATEWGTLGLDQGISERVKAGIGAARDYDPDDLDSALQATKGRARLPFGWTTLDLAWHLAQQEPIRLLDPMLSGRRVPTVITSLARQLQLLQGEEPILLPIDQVRALLGQRKVVVSGAVQRLVEGKLLDYANKSYHTGKAREFRFVGVESEHFEKVNPSGNQKLERQSP